MNNSHVICIALALSYPPNQHLQQSLLLVLCLMTAQELFIGTYVIVSDLVKGTMRMSRLQCSLQWPQDL